MPAARKKTRKKAPKMSQKELWESKLKRSGAVAIPYSMKQGFTPLTKVEHPTFGVGVVANCPTETKMEIIFQDKNRILVQNK